jgi:acetolactate synthase-1/2/3 large subunit
MTLQNPDFVAYAQSYGAIGHRVESAEALAPLIRECFATPGVHLIDVPIDYSDNERVLNREIKRLSAQL